MQYDYERFLTVLGIRVKQLRKVRKTDAPVDGHGLRFHLGQVAKIENGVGVPMQTMLKICAAFDMTPEDLVRGLGHGYA